MVAGDGLLTTATTAEGRATGRAARMAAAESTGGPAIGRIELDNPLALAPMAGVTDQAFRTLCKEQGCALLVTEMISDRAFLYDNSRTNSIVAFTPYERPVAAQLAGAEPEVMATAAAKLEREVAPDIIDINMGCPAPKIVKNHEGSALMRNVPLAAAIVRAVVSAVSVPVTVKTRKGWTEDEVNAVELAQAVAEAGAAAITVHGRVRTQYYSGVADWDIIRKVREALPASVPVIGNGDVRGPASALRMLSETGCDAVMIGRAAMGNPWVFARCLAAWRGDPQPPEPTLDERVAMACRHLDLLIALKGERTAVLEMRRHAPWYIRGHRGAAAVRSLLVRAGSRAEICNVLTGFTRQ